MMRTEQMSKKYTHSPHASVRLKGEVGQMRKDKDRAQEMSSSFRDTGQNSCYIL